MDYYRLRCPPCTNCSSIAMTQSLLEHANPRIDDKHKYLFKLAKEREERKKLFFSQTTLKQEFQKPEMIKKALECPCGKCVEHRRQFRSLLDFRGLDTELRKADGKACLLMIVLIYLGKLHLLYPLRRKGAYSALEVNKHLQDLDPSQKDPMFDSPIERRLFREAFTITWPIFNPKKLELNHKWQLNNNHIDCEEDDQFPFIDEPYPNSKKGNFGRITKVSIHDEYLGERIKKTLKSRYRSSVKNNDQYLFVIKSIGVPKPGEEEDDAAYVMESDSLRLLSSITEKKARDHVIDLLATFRWRDEVHFVFPFVDGDLEDVLLKGWLPKGLKKEAKNEGLVGFWLWKQIVCCCEALAIIHTGIEDPFKNEGRKSQSKVIAFHFDLKPANILVTYDGVLKITDFGQSTVALVGKDEKQSVFYQGGDPIYRAPEGNPTWRKFSNAYSTYSGSLANSNLSAGSIVTSATSSGSTENIKVYLNFDVWSMACIMTEILVFFNKNFQAVANFQTERQNDPGTDRYSRSAAFYNKTLDKAQLKPSVTKFLSDFNDQPRLNAEKNYVNRVVELIHDMFNIDNEKRVFSDTVAERLNHCRERFQEENQRPLPDAIANRVKIAYKDRREKHKRSEIGCPVGPPNRKILKSFLEIENIRYQEIPAVSNIHDNWSSCRLLLLCKESSPQEILLYIGYETPEGVRTPAWKIHADDCWVHLDYVHGKDANMMITLLIQGNGDRGTQRLVFDFSETDADHAISYLTGFQAALFGQKVVVQLELCEVSVVGESSIPTMEMVKIQVWESKLPQILQDSEITQSDSRSKAPSVASTSTARHYCLVIMAAHSPFVVLPLHKSVTRFVAHGTEPFTWHVKPRKPHSRMDILKQKTGVPTWSTENPFTEFGSLSNTIPLSPEQFKWPSDFNERKECRDVLIKFDKEDGFKLFKKVLYEKLGFHFG